MCVRILCAMLPRLLLIAAAVLTLSVSGRAQPTPAGSITIDASKLGHTISPGMYGIFFEEISHAGDGGLYAELVQNRGFEDSRLPPMCLRDGDFIVPPRTPHFDTGQIGRASCRERGEVGGGWGG